MVTLHEDQYTFLKMSFAVLPRTKNDSDKCFRGNEKKTLFNNFFNIIVPFMI